jgi:hypothetical protein
MAVVTLLVLSFFDLRGCEGNRPKANVSAAETSRVLVPVPERPLRLAVAAVLFILGGRRVI